MIKWCKLEKEKVLKILMASQETGLSEEAVHGKRREYGENALLVPKENKVLATILNQLKDTSTVILILAALLSLFLALKHNEGFIEPIIISTIVVMNIILAITQEGKAEKALEALEELNTPVCVVLRSGKWQELEAAELVPGDILLLESGFVVPADGRLLESRNLYVDEAILTGESEPSEKNAELIFADQTPLGDQINMVFSGSMVTSGRGTAVVTCTGMETQIGHIAGFLGNKTKNKTPLQKRLDNLSKFISIVAIISAVVLFIVGMIRGESFWNMILLAVSLAVAAVPETLSLIVTLSLANGVKKMAQKNTLIRKLPAVETLGNTSIICSDKTGTLTQNKMTIKRLWIKGLSSYKSSEKFNDKQLYFLKMLAMASNATAENDKEGNMKFIGNPTEIAIMRLLNDNNISKKDLEKEYKKVGEIPFSSERKMMTTILKDKDNRYIILSKGAIDRLPLTMSTDENNKLYEMHDSFADEALRVIGLGIKSTEELPAEDALEEMEKDLELFGIIGIIDPPRSEAAQAIEVAKNAGIRTIMITGDHAITAGAIAKEIGILSAGQKVITGAELEQVTDEEFINVIQDYSVYARVSPEDKIRIVETWQKKGEIVSMTGDGVNDAPALKAANVGIAMGQTGTEVAKSTADIVLTDDNFASIIKAVYEGRSVYANIRRVIYFLLVCNMSEIIVVLFAQLAGWGVIVTPVMLLLINVLGDGIPGLQLAKETSDYRIMSNGPLKKNQSFFSGGLSKVIIYQTIVCSLVVLTGYYIGAFVMVDPSIVPDNIIGQTLAFLVLGLTSILHIFTVRSRKSILKSTLADNYPLAVSALIMFIVFILIVAIPELGNIFGMTTIGKNHWIAVGILTIIPTITAEIGKYKDNN